MPPLLRRSWPALAVSAGAMLIYFEHRQQGGVTGDNVVWLGIGALIVVLGLISLFQKPIPPGDGD
jgi:hypothetical protein